MTGPGGRDPQAEQDHAEFTGWAEAQSYDESFDFNLEDMRDAFTAGMQAARDLDDATLAAEVRAGHVRIETDAPKPAPELAAARGALEDIARAAQGHADSTGAIDHNWLVETALRGLGRLPEGDDEPQAAPDLGAAYADLESEIREATVQIAQCRSDGLPCRFCERQITRAMTAIDAYARDVARHERTREQPAPDDVRPREGERGMKDVTCGSRAEEFGTNFRDEEIECPECEARRCPHCKRWFGGGS